MAGEEDKPKKAWEGFAKKEDLFKLLTGLIVVTAGAKIIEKIVGTPTSWGWIFAALLLTLLVVAAITGVVAHFKTQQIIRDLSTHFQEAAKVFQALSERIAALERLPSSAQKLAQWILSNESLRLLERSKSKVNCPEIWIVTKEPNEDTGGSDWVPVIRNNIEDGISYVYICPDEPSVKGGLQGLKDVFRGNLQQCRVRLLQPAEFNGLPYSEIVVYDPKNSGKALECLCEIDVPERGWWLKLLNRHRNEVLGRLEPLTSGSRGLDSF